jgi:predicted metal-dependent hydrolase
VSSPLSLDFVRHPRARRYVIRVRPDGRVRVTVPRWGSKRQAQNFVDAQRAWIERQRRRAAERQRDAAPACSPERLKELRARARKELPEELDRLAALNGLRVARVSVRNQRGRWGSCSPKAHICLNWRLAVMPDFVREYVLVHELMHLKQLNHSPKFWSLVADACPDYQSARVWLRQNARLIEHQL